MSEKTKRVALGGHRMTIASILTMAAAAMGSAAIAADPGRPRRRTEPAPRAKPATSLMAEIRAWNEEVDKRKNAKLEHKAQRLVQGRRK